MIQSIQFKDTDLPRTPGLPFHTNQWRTEIGTTRQFVLYNSDGEFVSVEGIRVDLPSVYEGKDPWIITRVTNWGTTEENLNQFQKGGNTELLEQLI